MKEERESRDPIQVDEKQERIVDGKVQVDQENRTKSKPRRSQSTVQNPSPSTVTQSHFQN